MSDEKCLWIIIEFINNLNDNYLYIVNQLLFHTVIYEFILS